MDLKNSENKKTLLVNLNFFKFSLFKWHFQIPEKENKEQSVVKSKQIFDLIGQELKDDKNLITKIDAIVVYYITKNSKLVATFS